MSQSIVLKCVLLGESAVGKSSLINRFINGTFNEDSLPTIVGCYSAKEVFYEKENTKIRYEIWDTAGQEKYRAINKIFYQDAYVNILVYDITKKPSFDALKDYWYQEVKDNAPLDAIIIIVGNKRDLYENEAVDEEEVKKFSESVNALYKQTSAQTGEGVNELFDMIGKQILTQENVEDFKNNKSKGNKFSKFKNDSTNIYSSVSTFDSNVSKKKKCC